MQTCYYATKYRISVTPLEVDELPEDHHLRKKIKVRKQTQVDIGSTATRTIASDPGKSE
jgi:hypothetical protein